MDTDFTQESVLRFLLNHGGDVRNADLLAHFKRFLRDAEERAQNRELFKRFVNSVATVRQEDGVSRVVLKKKYRHHLGTGARDDKKREAKATEPAVGGKQKRGESGKSDDVTARKTSHARDLRNTERVLPVAGIVNNNDLEAVDLEKLVKNSSVPTRDRNETTGGNNGKNRGTSPPKPSPGNTDSKRSSGSGQSFEQPWELKGSAESPEVKHKGAGEGQWREADGCSRESYCPPPDRPHREGGVISYKEEPPSSVWPFPISLGQSQISASSPCLADLPAASTCGQGALSRSSDSLLRPGQTDHVRFFIQEAEDYETMAAPPLHGPTPADRLQGLSFSQNSLHEDLSTKSEWTRPLVRDNWSSDDLLNYTDNQRTWAGCPGDAMLLSQLHRPERPVPPFHCSTGQLLDENQRVALPGSAPGNSISHGPMARRLSHRLRSRMCRSLGSDLDQAFQEDSDAARRKRLHRITSFLTVSRPASASSGRTLSTLDGISPAGSTRSLGQDSVSSSHRHSQLPLDAREHDWFVKAASGAWTDIYSLFRDDPSLLSKRDFVSGYTALHWIAKHGDHRVLNTLSYGVSKAGIAMDVNPRSTCGYTPLHLAAIHGHKNLLRLLANKFKANVMIRDNSGKKAWQYLEKCDDRDLLDLLGATRKTPGGSTGVQRVAEKPPVPPTVTTSSAAVKRHSSLAVMFKHKAPLRLSATPETFI